MNLPALILDKLRDNDIPSNDTIQIQAAGKPCADVNGPLDGMEPFVLIDGKPKVMSLFTRFTQCAEFTHLSCRVSAATAASRQAAKMVEGFSFFIAYAGKHVPILRGVSLTDNDLLRAGSFIGEALYKDNLRRCIQTASE